MKKLLVMLAVALPLLVLARDKTPPPPPAPAPEAAKVAPTPEQQRYLDERSSLISTSFQFNAAQSAKFWPVYQQYQDAFLALGPPVERPANPDALDDAAASKVAGAFLDRDAKVTALRNKFFPEFEKALGGKLAARFIALDRKLWLQALVKATAVPAAAPPAAPAPVVAPAAAPAAVVAPAAVPAAPPAAVPAAVPAAAPAAAPPAPPAAAPVAAPPPAAPPAAPAAPPAN